MSESPIFTYFNEHPIIPASIIVTNVFAFIPIVCLLCIAQIAPLHSNCRYILCVWTISFAAVYLVSSAVAKLDIDNETGYMPLDMYKPACRWRLYRCHVICTTFCSTFEIALSIERIVAIVSPRRYHFSGIAWKTLSLLTVCLFIFSCIVDYYVHNEEEFLIGGCLLIIIETSIIVAGSVSMKVCGVRYEKMYGKSSLTARYQVKEAYEMSRAMIPAYIASFSLKASMIATLCAYFAFRENYGHFLGYLHAHYFMTHAINGSFAMTILLLKNPQLRKQTLRKFRVIFGLRPAERVKTISTKEETEVHFSMLLVSWK